MNASIRDLRQKLQCDLCALRDRLSSTLVTECVSDEGFATLLDSYAQRVKEIIAQDPAQKVNGHRHIGLASNAQRSTAQREWQEFTNDQRVVDFCEQQRLTLAKGRLWWWCANQRRKDGTPRYGEIRALPGSRGVCRISNGVDVWIEKEDGTLYLGHVAWFKGDRTMPVKDLPKSREKQAQDLMKDSKDSTPSNAEQLRTKLLELLS